MALRNGFAESAPFADTQTQASAAPEMSDEEVRLLSSPYLQGDVPAAGREGVVLHDRDLAFEGLNLFASGHAPEALLMDMDGTVLHRWSFDIKRHFKHAGPPYSDYWSDVHVFDDGSLLAMNSYIGLVKIDRNSVPYWFYQCACHHDFFIDGEGTIYVLSQKPAVVGDDRVWDNFITVLSPAGELVKEVSFLELFRKYPDRSLFEKLCAVVERHSGEDEHLDIFHANSLQVFDGTLAGRSPLFAKGNVLVTIPTLGVVAIIDIKSEELLWHLHREFWAGWQHGAKLLENGHILLFDNHYTETQSRVVEFDPLAKKLVWQYDGDGQNPFFSRDRGTVQRLANGNTLFVESRSGRAFEVTPQKKLAWEFVNPNRTGEGDALIAVILRMRRLSGDFPLDWLEREKR